ncbi:DUF7266 family protein [Halorussus halobius]|uniref:DUF7266 family protein n=1 Tax=Halorussus halobius TaxID=1710537 RepID=UPI0010931723|nr:hypothetical protein [Halorussus halobius]
MSGRRTGFATDRRAVSTTVTYTLTVAITTVLVSGLVIAAGGAVSDQRERAVRQELGVVGERLAAELEGADGLVADGNADLRLRTTHPDALAGTRYSVALVASAPGPCDRYPCLALNASDPAASVTVALATETAVRSTRVAGGDVVVVYEPDNGTLALEGAA